MRGPAGICWPCPALIAIVRRILIYIRTLPKGAAMKSIVYGGVIVVALLAASVTPSAAIPIAELSVVQVDVSTQNIAWRRHHYYRQPLLYVAPGLYYGCRPGWYCFGPPYRAWYTHAWYGGFNSIYGYQGARWRPPQPSTETTNTPGTTPPTNTPGATTPPTDLNITPSPGR